MKMKLRELHGIQIINILYDNSLDIQTIIIRINGRPIYFNRGSRSE